MLARRQRVPVNVVLMVLDVEMAVDVATKMNLPFQPNFKAITPDELSEGGVEQSGSYRLRSLYIWGGVSLQTLMLEDVTTIFFISFGPIYDNERQNKWLQ
jgi:hypothetical protein